MSARQKVVRTRDENIEDAIGWAEIMISDLKQFKATNEEHMIYGAFRQIRFRMIDLGLIKKGGQA